jgi:hypothetical protein
LHVSFQQLTLLSRPERFLRAISDAVSRGPKEFTQMSEKVVLPKFDIPSESMHPAIKAVLSVGVVLLISMVILGGAVWRRRSAQMAAEARVEALIAARTAEANAVAEAAKARAAEAAAREAAAQAKIAATKAAAVAAASAKHDEGSKTVASASGHHRAGGHHHGKAVASKGAVAAKSGGSDDKKTAPKSTRNNDAIDKLLAQYK